MYKWIQFDITTAPVRYSIGRSFLRRGFLLIWLVFGCLVLSPPMQAQLPNIFAADDPSGSVNSGGANIAYLQNTTGSDVTLTLDGNTITTKANRLNIFDRSSGTWALQKVILNQQSQPVSPSNTFSTPTPTPTPTPTSTPTPTPPPTPTPTPTPSPTPTPTPAPDFSLAISPSSVTVNPGSGAASYTVTITPAAGFKSGVTLAVSGLPSGASGTFNPNPATGSSALAVNVSSTVAKGTYTFTVTGTGGSPTFTHTATASFKVPKP
jgi:hypothetical protein